MAVAAVALALLYAVLGANAIPLCTVVISPVDPGSTPLPLNLMEVGLYWSAYETKLPDWTPKGPDYIDVVAAGGSIALSSTWPGYPVANCFDGDASTMCATNNRDPNPTLTITLPEAYCNTEVISRLAVKIVNRPNAARCLKCADRILSYRLRVTSPYGNAQIRLALDVGPGLPVYTLFPRSQCVAAIYPAGTLPAPAERFINLNEIVLQTDFEDYLGAPNAVLGPQDLTLQLSSTFKATGTTYGVDNCFDKLDSSDSSVCSTGYNDPYPVMTIYFPCFSNRGLVSTTFNNRPNSPACRTCQDRIKAYQYLVVDNQFDIFRIFAFENSDLTFTFPMAADR